MLPAPDYSPDDSGSEPSPDPGRPWPQGRVGAAAILGRPNVGKSTFLNAVLDFHLAPVSREPQTTRKRLLGVHSDDRGQILFLDCPGVHHGTDPLTQIMLGAVESALDDADVILCMADPTRPPAEEDALAASLARDRNKPLLLAINKCDRAGPEARRRARDFFLEHLGPHCPVFEISALDPTTLPPLIEALRNHLPQGPFLFPPDYLTDARERDIGAELIREAVFEFLRDEVPHATAVVIDEWRELPNARKIQAVLYVEHESQKGIVIGRDGAVIQKIRRTATQKLRDLCGCPVRLKLWVKVAKAWRRKRRWIRDWGVAGR